MTTKAIIPITGLALVMLALGAFQLGCDSAGTETSIDVTPNNLLISDDRAVTLLARARDDLGDAESSVNQNLGQSLQENFTEVQVGSNTVLVLPLVWSVSSPELGNIASSAGQLAVYLPIKDAEGTQIISVRDQGNASGLAAIYQK